MVLECSPQAGNGGKDGWEDSSHTGCRENPGQKLGMVFPVPEWVSLGKDKWDTQVSLHIKQKQQKPSTIDIRGLITAQKLVTQD